MLQPILYNTTNMIEFMESYTAAASSFHLDVRNKYDSNLTWVATQGAVLVYVQQYQYAEVNKIISVIHDDHAFRNS